jgi:hypothetical protein
MEAKNIFFIPDLNEDEFDRSSCMQNFKDSLENSISGTNCLSLNVFINLLFRTPLQIPIK